MARETAARVAQPVTEIGEALAGVQARIVRAAEACGRDASTVRLIAISKMQPAAAIREAYAQGQRAFGESYAQELDAKAQALADLPDIEWHFVGHLQTNKAKLVARSAHLVHTVDSRVLAREIAKRAEQAGRASLPVLIEVNVGAEPQKHGAPPSELAEVMEAVRAEPRLALRGLMTMPPADDLDATRRVFETLGTLRALHGGPTVLPELSIGMSQDLEVAIACGATMVRVGTAIFGSRRP